MHWSFVVAIIAVIVLVLLLVLSMQSSSGAESFVTSAKFQEIESVAVREDGFTTNDALPTPSPPVKPMPTYESISSVPEDVVKKIITQALNNYHLDLGESTATITLVPRNEKEGLYEVVYTSYRIGTAVIELVTNQMVVAVRLENKMPVAYLDGKYAMGIDVPENTKFLPLNVVRAGDRILMRCTHPIYGGLMSPCGDAGACGVDVTLRPDKEYVPGEFQRRWVIMSETKKSGEAIQFQDLIIFKSDMMRGKNNNKPMYLSSCGNKQKCGMDVTLKDASDIARNKSMYSYKLEGKADTELITFDSIMRIKGIGTEVGANEYMAPCSQTRKTCGWDVVLLPNILDPNDPNAVPIDPAVYNWRMEKWSREDASSNVARVRAAPMPHIEGPQVMSTTDILEPAPITINAYTVPKYDEML